MARLAVAEVSDDEFPPLADLIRKHAKSDQDTCDSKAGRAVYSTLHLEDMVSSKSKARFDSAGQISHRNTRETQPRRRLLNKKCDNPLLHLSDHGKKITPSSSLSETQNSSIGNLSVKKYYPEEDDILSSLGEASNPDKEDSYNSDPMGLSDFIVSDSSYLGDRDSKHGTESRVQVSKSKRKLMRGRRPSRGNSPTLDSCSPPPDHDGMKSRGTDIRRIHRSGSIDLLDDSNHVRTIKERGISANHSKIGDQTSRSGLEEPFHMLSFSPPKRKSPNRITRDRSRTPSRGRQKFPVRLVSPKKPSRIPSTSHCPSMDIFWSQDVVNEWNDEFSPRKAPRPATRPSSESDVGGNFHFEASRKAKSVKERQSIVEAKKTFARKKHGIAQTFLREVDDAVAEGMVSKMAASTGGIKIIWSKKLSTTAGRANWKRESFRPKSPGPDQIIFYHHHASIELAEKIIDDEHRLLNVLAHEFCHLANFMVSGIKTNPHGQEFKVWAKKCSEHFNHRGIEVTTKHSYVIDYRYIWECINCGMEFKRHSRSIDPAKHQCGSCKGRLMQSKPVLKGNGTVSEYQIFMKDNMKKIREDNPGSSHKEIMGLVGKKYQEYKASKLSLVDKTDLGIDVKFEQDVVLGEECPAASEIDIVTRKIDFLDLTST